MTNAHDRFTADCEDEDEDEASREAALCYRWAREFHRRGFNVVPRNPVKKYPAVKWAEYQRRRITDDEILRHYHLYAGGVGFITGRISGVIVIETDGPNGEAVLADFARAHGALPDTFTVRSGSGRGLHRYYRHPGHHVATRANTEIKLDVKGDGGFCVLPPTLHGSGGRYEVEGGAKPAPLPEGLLEFIEMEAVKAKGEKAKPHRLGRSGAFPALVSDDHGRGSNTNCFMPTPVNPVNVAIVASMLNVLSDGFAIEHDDWFRVGLALHDFHDGEVGLALWKKFSQRCPEKAADTNFETRWASFGNGYSGKKITLGWLRHHAEAHGWRAPRQWDRSTMIEK